MTLSARTSLGPYEILSPLGAGGMGEVYRARDTRLDRDVAIKVLPESIARDRERVLRFEREAKLLASLNHPNIAAIYGFEEHRLETGATHFLVLEYVEGETLAQRLKRGAMPVDEALDVGKQIAEGVEAAHEKGVIHRDLKPGNVMVKPDGTVKVLDFGLARAMVPDSAASGTGHDSPTMVAHSPTITADFTRPGVVLGTAPYMSPEQARGRPLDKRTDIWSFGVILYEMLTGASPFVGETVSDSIGAVLHKEVNFDRLPATTPPMVRHVLSRCLARDKSLRLCDIGDARIELLATDPEQEAGAAKSPCVLAWCVTVAALLVAAGGIGYGVLRSPKVPPRPVVRFSIECPITSDPGAMLRPRVAIAPDGSLIALQGDNDESTLLLRRMDQTELRELDLPWPARLMTWTPDNRWVVVMRGDELWRASPTGESPRLICRLPEEGWMWSDCVRPLDEQTLIVGMVRGLYTVPIDGGDPQEVLDDDGDDMLVQPTPIPGTDAVLFLEINSGRVEMLRGGKRSVVFDFGGDRLMRLSYAPSGHVFVALWEGSRDQGTWMIPFDVESLTAIGDPVRMLPFSAVSVSHDGTLVYAPYGSVPLEERSLVWVTREGVVEGRIGAPLLGASEPALSPDGKRIALTGFSSSSSSASYSDWDLYIADAVTGSRAVLRDALGHEHHPFWRSDNETVVFSTWNAGIRYAREVSASGDKAPVTLDESAFIAMPTRDGRYLLTALGGIRYVATESGEERVFSENSTRSFDVTSDSRYLAYQRSGEGIMLQRFPEGGALTTVTNQDAYAVRWNTDDTELFYWVKDDFYAVAVDLSGPQPVVETPERLFNAQEVGVRPGFDYDIASDGRLLMVKTPEDAAPAPKSVTVHVVEQWAREYTQGRKRRPG